MSPKRGFKILVVNKTMAILLFCRSTNIAMIILKNTLKLKKIYNNKKTVVKFSEAVWKNY